MRRYLKHIMAAVCIITLLAASFTVPGADARADTISGRVNITYDPYSGELEAKYIGSQSLDGSGVFTWYLNGEAIAEASSQVYEPVLRGKYTAKFQHPDYAGSVVSNTVMLYQVHSDTALTYNSPNGLYKAGNSVRATKPLANNEEIAEWATSVTGLALTTRSNYVTFTMPAADVTLTCTSDITYSVKVYGGKANVSRAAAGEIIDLTASSVSGHSFLGWKSVGGGVFDNAASSSTQFQMPEGDVKITAVFVENSVIDRALSSSSSSWRRSSSLRSNSSSNNNRYGYGSGSSSVFVNVADPLHAVYEVLWGNNYKIDIFHHSQGPVCDYLFKTNLNGDTLVLDYLNIVINRNYNIHETPTPITLRLTIPMDLQWPGRKWRMLCVGRYGQVYSFPDEDIDDETITFSPDRFYAFAMCYNDNPDVAEQEEVKEDIIMEEPVEDIEFSDEALAKLNEKEQVEEQGGISQAHTTVEVGGISDTETQSELHDSSGPQGANNSLATEISKPVNITSDKSSAIQNSRGTRISEINL